MGRCFSVGAMVVGMVLSAAIGVRAAAVIHVSPQGDDAGGGSRDRPLATLRAAQRKVRELLAAQPQAVRVELAAGTYWLDEPLVLGNEDGGPTAEEPVTWAAAGGDVVVSGGRPIDGWREQAGRWAAKVEISGEAPAFRDLWVNGRRAVRARTPNDGYYRVESAGPDNRTSFTAAAGELVELAQPQEAEVALLHDWSMSRVRLEAVDPSTRTYRVQAPIGGEAAQFAISNFEPHPRYFIENAPELLDAPGEWHLDEAAGVVRYVPRAGETLDGLAAVAPRAEQLLVVRGQGDLPVRNLRFEGITFAHSRFEIPPYGYAGIQSNAYERRLRPDDHEYLSMAAAVEVDKALGCTFANCRFAHLGACGVHVSRSQEVSIERCRFNDVAGDGILIGTRNDGEEPATARVAVVDCTIEHCGASFYGAVGVWVGFAQDTLVAHNEIRHLPYTGVSVGWRWDDTPTSCRANRVEANHIHHVMQILSDGGGIYTLGRQRGTRLVGNLIHDVPLNAGRAESNGMFIDEGSTEIVIERNTIYSVARSPLRFHRAGENLVRQNRLATSAGVPTFMYNSTDAAAIDRVDNQEIAVEGWAPAAGDPALANAGPR